MENQRPRPVPKGKPPGEPTPEAEAGSDTPTAKEVDPLWEELGSTRVVVQKNDGLNSPSNHTELSPSRILGKNLVTLGDFKLGKKLGEGAMGAVYKAQRISYPQEVALKILFPHVANNPKLVERLRREGLVMGQLDHPNIVKAYEGDVAEGCHYVAMEYVSGHSVQKWLAKRGSLPVADAVRITLDCARALAYAHAQGLVHRDIKPDNILLTKTGVVKVADLGMVKMHDEDMSLTQTGHAVGTPWFMPLEQARNAKEIDGRSDIYALGCTLYSFLTGNPPFMGRTIVDVIQAKEVGTFAPARQANANVPERLDLVIAKMTAKLPKNRYQTCEEVIKALEGLNLAGDKLGFMRKTTVVPDPSQDTPLPGKTAIAPLSAKSTADAAATALDPDLWYVQIKAQDGKVSARKFTTAQLKKMLQEGTIKLTAFVSHSPDEGFRAAATYKEFQGSAMSKMTKQAADKNTARYRGIYKKIEENERQRDEKERAEKTSDAAMSANTRYWLGIALTVLPIVLGIAAVIALLWYFTSMF